MTNPNTDYEKFVRDITQALLNAQGLDTVQVQHDVQLQGISRSHQVDVYWEYRLAGVLHRVIINCKRYADTVDATDVCTLGGVLVDLPGVRGLVVTTKGFQKGAVEYAKTHQIGLKVIRPPVDADWDGRLRQVNLDLRIHIPVFKSCFVQLDEEWVKQNVEGDPASLLDRISRDAHATAIRDLETGTATDFQVLFNRALNENPTEVGQDGKGVVRWNDARLEQPGMPALRVVLVAFEWTIEEGPPLRYEIRSDPMAIVRDALAGTLLFVDQDGQITGDIAAELGPEAMKQLPQA